MNMQLTQYPCICNVVGFDTVHPADFEDARLHRRIQSVEHIARLAESKVSAHMAVFIMFNLQIGGCLLLGVPTPILHSYKGKALCWQAGDNSPRVPKLGSGLKLAPDDEDVCPTCLEPYLEGKMLSQSSCSSAVALLYMLSAEGTAAQLDSMLTLVCQ